MQENVQKVKGSEYFTKLLYYSSPEQTTKEVQIILDMPGPVYMCLSC